MGTVRRFGRIIVSGPDPRAFGGPVGLLLLLLLLLMVLALVVVMLLLLLLRLLVVIVAGTLDRSVTGPRGIA